MQAAVAQHEREPAGALSEMTPAQAPTAEPSPDLRRLMTGMTFWGRVMNNLSLFSAKHLLRQRRPLIVPAAGTASRRNLIIALASRFKLPAISTPLTAA